MKSEFELMREKLEAFKEGEYGKSGQTHLTVNQAAYASEVQILPRPLQEPTWTKNDKR